MNPLREAVEVAVISEALDEFDEKLKEKEDETLDNELSLKQGFKHAYNLDFQALIDAKLRIQVEVAKTQILTEIREEFNKARQAISEEFLSKLGPDADIKILKKIMDGEMCPYYKDEECKLHKKD